MSTWVCPVIDVMVKVVVTCLGENTGFGWTWLRRLVELPVWLCRHKHGHFTKCYLLVYCSAVVIQVGDQTGHLESNDHHYHCEPGGVTLPARGYDIGTGFAIVGFFWGGKGCFSYVGSQGMAALVLPRLKVAGRYEPFFQAQVSQVLFMRGLHWTNAPCHCFTVEAILWCQGCASCARWQQPALLSFLWWILYLDHMDCTQSCCLLQVRLIRGVPIQWLVFREASHARASGWCAVVVCLPGKTWDCRPPHLDSCYTIFPSTWCEELFFFFKTCNWNTLLGLQMSVLCWCNGLRIWNQLAPLESWQLLQAAHL